MKEVEMFIAYVKQSGEGCDYTIGCGYTLWELKETTTKDEAIQKIKQYMGEEDRLSLDERGQPFYERIILFEVIDRIELPIADWYSEQEMLDKEYIAKEIENAEKAEFERLKAKFG